MIYFDNAAVEKPTKQTVEFAKKKLDLFVGKHSAVHYLGQKAKFELEKSRSDLAGFINAKPINIKFCTNSKDSHLFLYIFLLELKPFAIITSEFEDDFLLNLYKKISETLNIPLKFVSLENDSGISLSDFKQMLEANNRAFISLSHVNNLTGRLLPITRIAKFAHKNDCIFHSDISHSIGKFDINIENFDLVTANSIHFGGIANAGFIAIRSKMNKYFYDFVENEDVVAISTMIFALQQKLENRESNLAYISDLKEYTIEQLAKNNIFNSEFFEENTHFSPYILNLPFAQVANFEMFLIKLDINNIAVGDARSNALPQMNQNIRISFSRHNSKTEIDFFVERLSFILNNSLKN